MNRRLINNILVALIIIIIMVLSYLVIRPILISIAFGLLFAYTFHPIYRKINKTIKIKTLSASLLMSLIAFLITIPAIYFIPKLIQQIFAIFEKVREINIAETIASLFPFLGKDPTSYSLLQNLNNIPGKVTSSLIDTLLQIVLNLPDLLIQTFVFLFTFFFAIRDSHKLGDYFREISPFSKATEKKFMKEFRGITNSVILGQVLIGFLQGITLGIGLWLLGVSNVLTWTIITIIASIIPMIGPWLVWVPVSIFLLISGNTTGGIILALYGGLFVSSIDNVIRPYLLSKSSQLPLVISLIGTVGGFYFLGILGLVLGPLILAYALIIIDFYKEGRLDELYRESRQGIKSYEIKS
jgi:predicted PurR-regulated permease PerM